MPIKRIAAAIEYLVDDDDDATFTKLAGVKMIGDPAKSRDEVDVTDLDDTIEQALGAPTIKMGDLKLSLFWDEADTTGQGLLEDLIDANTVCDHQIKFPFSDGTIIKTFSGWVKELGEATYEVKGEVMREVTIHVTSLATVT